MALANGDIVVFYDYITTGESRGINKLLLEKGKFDSATGKIEDISVASFLDAQEKTASYVIKEVKIGGGDPVPFSKEWLDSLPSELGNTIYEEINKLTQVSQLNPDQKKV